MRIQCTYKRVFNVVSTWISIWFVDRAIIVIAVTTIVRIIFYRYAAIVIATVLVITRCIINDFVAMVKVIVIITFLYRPMCPRYGQDHNIFRIASCSSLQSRPSSRDVPATLTPSMWLGHGCTANVLAGTSGQHKMESQVRLHARPGIESSQSNQSTPKRTTVFNISCSGLLVVNSISSSTVVWLIKLLRVSKLGHYGLQLLWIV